MSTIKTMRSRGASSAQIAPYVKLSPGTVRYHVRRLDSRRKELREFILQATR